MLSGLTSRINGILWGVRTRTHAHTHNHIQTHTHYVEGEFMFSINGMRWFWSVTCISLGLRWHCRICKFKWWQIYTSAFHASWVCASVCVISECMLCFCVNLSSTALPKSAQTYITFTLLWVSYFSFFSFVFFFFCSCDMYLQAENLGFSYCIFTFHLLIVNAGKRGGRGAKIKMHTDVFRDSEAPVFSYAFYTGNKKRSFNYFGINALVTKYQHFLFFCLFSLLFSFAHLFLK